MSPAKGKGTGPSTAAAAGSAQAKKKQGKQGAVAAAAEQLLADCQQWQLFSCGVEGRLLTWKLPALHEWGMSGPGATGNQGAYVGRGGADRAGRWGAAAAAAPVTVQNDVSGYHHAVTHLRIIPCTSGLLRCLPA